ncbi:HAD-IIA family hydrolase [Amycolatopsis dendrobii]|uniref:HAD-IIA family hydrolase n=1 Tax=Amycolatopsis dendrobii TaxID=2760662 RepID=A0A7W3ZGJ9_9PSEU|nr:HAD-IIA family hydrolase [Amycolatopsis dendrobii]MBB1160242.1 HAD-IIA family hydrolase [Amycolatopsis dendrobii]
MTDVAYDALLFDLDGTVYHGPQVIEGAAETVAAVREQGTAVRFVTNNASKAPSAVAEHLRDLGISADTEEVHTSAQAAAGLLRDRLAAGSKVLIVGTASLGDQISAAELEPVRTAGDDVSAVVQGHSPETGWADLAEASIVIRAGGLWVATNTDTTLPTERGLMPGNGSMVGALRIATGAEPVVAGKPQPLLFETAARSAEAKRPLVVGDRLDTDIAGAVAAGLDSLCVLTGIATPATLLTAIPAERPTHLGADLAALARPVDELRVGKQTGWEISESDVLTVRGEGDKLDLLRALCDSAWRTGVAQVRADGDAAAAAVAGLGLA